MEPTSILLEVTAFAQPGEQQNRRQLFFFFLASTPYQGVARFSGSVRPHSLSGMEPDHVRNVW